MEKKETYVENCGGIEMPAQSANKITEIVFILDASGSMYGLEKDTVGGVNSILEEQKKMQNGDTVYVSTVIFSNDSRVVHDRVELAEIPLMNEKDFVVYGCTALCDAIGGAIHHIENIHKYARKEDVPSKTMFVIMTDGMENASRTYNRSLVKQSIEEKQKIGWEFVFLAANIDAAETASDFGIARERAVDWTADEEGVHVLYNCVNACVSNARGRKAYSRDVFADADANYKKKKKK